MRYLIGIGTYMGLDDSIGLRIAEAIGEDGLDHGFQSIDLGGNLLDVLHYLGPETGQVLLVDTARMGLDAGEYRFFTADQVITRKELPGFSTHEDDLMKVLEFARSLEMPLPPITIMGIEPERIAAEEGLSPALERRFDEYVEAAVTFMRQH
jgi:hydrogenase maturation protease